MATNASATPESANPGLIRPPFVYLAAIILGVVLHLIWPVRLMPRPISVLLGMAIVLIAIALFVSATRTFRAAGTPVPGNLPTTTIVQTGPYRWTRNPIYLAFSLLQLGVAFCVDSPWLLVTLAFAVGLISFVVIPREEKYLEARFAAEYLPYKSCVRRWL